jgi:pilus assembly protein Flp/PilA
MKQLLSRLVAEDEGQDLIEYAMVAALIGLGVYGAAKNMDNSIKGTFNSVATSLTNAV